MSVETNLRLERLLLLNGEAVRLCDDGDDVDDVAELFHDDDVDGAQGVAGGVDKVQAAVDARVLDVAVAHGGELLAEVRAVLVFDVLDNRVPAFERTMSEEWAAVVIIYVPVLVVDLVAVPGCVDDVQPQLDTVFDNNCDAKLFRVFLAIID